VVISGLEIGYTIKSQEVKTVGDKGDFSRYAIRFYVTNTTNQPLIIPYRDGNRPGNVSDLLVRFDIPNATGARLTSNTAMLRAAPYSAMTLVDDKDPHTHKMIKVKRMVQAGYTIQAGQTISADEIVIVPLNTLPDVKASCFINGQQQGPPTPSNVPDQVAVQNNPAPVIYTQGFLKFKNVFNNTYINIEKGPPVCSSINNGWWSAQWQLMPVPGTSYFNIKNKWKGSFIDIERGYITVSLNAQSPGSMWSMEPTQDPNIFKLKNAKTGGYLSLVSNNLVVSNNTHNDFSSAWRLEQP